MSKDCDVFSDTYGCVFTDCEGYQAPFPLLRLDGAGSDGTIRRLRAVAHCRSVPATHKLLTLDFGETVPCRSFREVLSASPPPISLQPASGSSVEHVSSMSHGVDLSAVVCRSEDAQTEWSVSFIRPPSGMDNHARQWVVPGVHSVSMANDNRAWCLYDKSGSNGVVVVDPEALLQDDAAEVMAPRTRGLGRVVTQSHDTAAVFHATGVAGVDQRSQSPNATWLVSLPKDSVLVPGDSCGLTGTSSLMCCTVEGRLLVYDQRQLGSTSIPVLDKSLGTHAVVRSWPGVNTALLIAGDQVGMLDTRSSLAVLGALQQSSDGDVLDAALLSGDLESGHLQICTTGLNGMVYHWRVTL